MVRLAVSVGCPSGIGPEVSVVAADAVVREEKNEDVAILLVGDFGAIMRAARGRKIGNAIGRSRIAQVDSPRFEKGCVLVWQPTKTLAARDCVLGRPSRAGGAAQLAWIDAACDLVSSHEADALVTGPVSKSVIALSGVRGARDFLGHTEHLQRRLHARDAVMCFSTDAFATALVTTHIPIAKVPRAITAASVARATFWLARFVAKQNARVSRVAVASLNPHAGESGRIGREESRIEKGIVLARRKISTLRASVEIVGPVPAETAFRLAANGEYRGVVAMYHDQATIPMKLVGFGDAVNVTLGLPIVRTSVDHGTAYDRAPRFDADARGMLAAMKLAVKLV